MPNSIFGLMLKLLKQYLTAEIILLKRTKVRVETKSELTRGQMSIDSRPAPPMRSKCLGSVAG